VRIYHDQRRSFMMARAAEAFRINVLIAQPDKDSDIFVEVSAKEGSEAHFRTLEGNALPAQPRASAGRGTLSRERPFRSSLTTS